MKRLVLRFGKYNVATFVIMGVGLILFLLTPLLYTLWNFDSDIPGVLIFLIGLAMWIVGLIVRIRSVKQIGWKRVRSLWHFLSTRKREATSLLFAMCGIWWIWYTYNTFEFSEFISYSALLIAATAGLAALLSLKFTRDTIRPYLAWNGTVVLGGSDEAKTLAFRIINTGSMPADNIDVKIQAFEIDEKVDLDNVSKRYTSFFDEEGKASKAELIQFPNQTWQTVVNADLTNATHTELWENLITRNVNLRLTIRYRSFRRKHKTLQTVAFDELSLSVDGREFHGISVEPQQWV